MARTKFQAPRSVESFADVQRALQLIQESLDQVSRSPYVIGLITTDFTPLSPSFQRVSPPAQGIRATLPRANEVNAADRIVLSIENPTGLLTLFAAPTQTINGVPAQSFSVAGVVELFSNGVDGWKSTSQLPGPPGVPGTPGSPGGGPAISYVGLPGRLGQTGRTGVPGRQGVDGAAGVAGAAGTAGPPGRAAYEAPRYIIPGPPGATGPAGPPGVAGPFLEQTTSSTGSLTDFALDPLANMLTFSGVGDITLSGLVGGFEGRRLSLRMTQVATTLRLKHEQTGSASGNRLRTPNQLDLVMRSRDQVDLIYVAGRWSSIQRARDWQNTSSVTWAAAQNDLAISDADRLRVQLTGSQFLTGIVPLVANADNDGQTLLIENRDDVNTLTIAHLSGSSAANNQILCPNNKALIVSPRSSTILRYDGASLAWRVMVAPPGMLVLSRHTRTGTGAFGVTQLAGTTWWRLQGQAGGGGGGGARVALTREAAAGAGGAAGGYFDIWIPATDVAGSAVTGSVGNGGAGGPLGAAAGGNTTLTYDGVTYTAFGGGGGIDSVSGAGTTAFSAGQLCNATTPGQGGDTDQTDFELQSGAGFAGIMFSGAALINMMAIGGNGGPSFFGAGKVGGRIVGADGVGAPGTTGAPGAGGGGGARIKNVAGAALDQAGTRGVVGIAILTQFSGAAPDTVQF